MPVLVDQEGVSARVILEFIDLRGKQVLEVGCGDGRMTFPLAESARHVVAIDPIEEDIQQAIKDTPDFLTGKITFLNTGIEDFDLADGSARFDIGIFTWSL
jgi:ubiquinone/menaquinone biosynthesis C-methylase UbiE